MELDEFNKKSKIALNTVLECEQLEILELKKTIFFDKDKLSFEDLLHDLARNENISEKVQLLLAVKVLDGPYATRELKTHLVRNKKLSDPTFEILLSQNDIFIFYFLLEYVQGVSDIRRNKVLKRLEDLGLSEILTKDDLYKRLHDFEFSEEVQSQILDHEYHLEYFVINPHLTKLVQLKIVQSQYYENRVSSSVTYVGTDYSENSSDDDFIDVDDYHIESKNYKEYIYQIFAEKNKNISELALIALFNKKDKRVLSALSKRIGLPKTIIFKFIEKNDIYFIKNILEFNELDKKFQFMLLDLKNQEVYSILAKKNWIDLDVVTYLINLNEVHILDYLSSSKSAVITDNLRNELNLKFKNHPDYVQYIYKRDDEFPF